VRNLQQMSKNFWTCAQHPFNAREGLLHPTGNEGEVSFNSIEEIGKCSSCGFCNYGRLCWRATLLQGALTRRAMGAELEIRHPA